MLSKLALTVATVALAIGASTPLYQARAEEGGVRVGVLTCNVDSGWGFIFGSSRKLKCTYAGSAGYSEHYAGHVNKFGVDIGYTAGAVIVWAVFAPTADIGKGALSGHYGGVTGGAAVGVGAGANVLVGGFHDSISLQPVSIQGNSGLNVAAGIAEVSLQSRP